MSHRRLALGVAVIVCLLALVFCLVRAYRQPNTPDVDSTSVSLESTTTATTYASYVGHWCDSENALRPTMSEAGMDQITIAAADADSVTFTVLHTAAAPAYRITGSETTITAPIADGTATFEFRDDRGSTCTGTIQFLEDKLVVEIRTTSAGEGANGSADMNCLMLRDQYHDTREVLEQGYGGVFAGVVGSYSCASEPTDIPSINVTSVNDTYILLDLTGTHNDTVYYRNLKGVIVGEADVELPIEEAGVTLRLHWENPGTIHVECLEGKPAGSIQQLLEHAPYWNSQFLHTS